ncbi:hypothetical protein ACFT8V_22545 [Streptomyces griseoincarnatus]
MSVTVPVPSGFGDEEPRVVFPVLTGAERDQREPEQRAWMTSGDR